MSPPGEAEGEELGEEDGEALGELDGETLGDADTEALGDELTEALGEELTEALGEELSEALIEDDGEALIEALGEELTEALGEDDGEALIEALGEELTEVLGEELSEALGDADGDSLGDVDGDSLGEGLGLEAMAAFLDKRLPQRRSALQVRNRPKRAARNDFASANRRRTYSTATLARFNIFPKLCQTRMLTSVQRMLCYCEITAVAARRLVESGGTNRMPDLDACLPGPPSPL